MNKDEAKQVLDALHCVIQQVQFPPAEIDEAVAIMRREVDAPELSVVATIDQLNDARMVTLTEGGGYDRLVPLYAAAPQDRKPLSDEQIDKCVEKVWGSYAEFDEVRLFTRLVESAHGITAAPTGGTK